MSQNAPALRLKRIEWGKYQTRDGRYTIMRDPVRSPHHQNYGFTSWLIFDEQSPDEGAMTFAADGPHFSTLADARAVLADHIADEARHAE